MNKEIMFAEICSQLSKAKKISLTQKEIANIKMTDKFNEDTLDVLKILIYGLENKEGEQRIYTKIKNYFKIR